MQFVPPQYHYPHHHPLPPHQPSIPQPNLYSPQQALHEYNSRPGSSMAYSQVSMWPQSSHYPQNPPNSKAYTHKLFYLFPNIVPPTDMYYPQQPQQPQQHIPTDFRQLLNRLTEKVDVLTEKVYFFLFNLKTK